MPAPGVGRVRRAISLIGEITYAVAETVGDAIEAWGTRTTQADLVRQNRALLARIENLELEIAERDDRIKLLSMPPSDGRMWLCQCMECGMEWVVRDAADPEFCRNPDCFSEEFYSRGKVIIA